MCDKAGGQSGIAKAFRVSEVSERVMLEDGCLDNQIKEQNLLGAVTSAVEHIGFPLRFQRTQVQSCLRVCSIEEKFIYNHGGFLRMHLTYSLSRMKQTTSMNLKHSKG